MKTGYSEMTRMFSRRVTLLILAVLFSTVLIHILNTFQFEGYQRTRSRLASNLLNFGGKSPPGNEFHDGGETVLKLTNTPAKLMKQRMANIDRQCELLKNTTFLTQMKPSGLVWTYGPMRLGYCITPKVGCTYWKRIMRFIGFDYPKDQKIVKPSDINRNFVHYGAINNIKGARLKNKTALRDDLKLFMFAREPFSRLWSAYIDKFLLPDFWRTDAKTIVKTVRKHASEVEKTCANNLTFAEFLTFVVFAGTKGSFNEHWEPSHRICSPCHDKFEMVGTQETFARDSNLILSHFGFGNLVQNESRLDRAEAEIDMLVTYNLKLEGVYKKMCYDRMDVAKRLWTAFQLNGYIIRNREFPQKQLENANFQLSTKPAPLYTQIVLNVVKNQTDLEWKSIKSQKRQMMIEAYRHIPDDVVKQIRLLYKHDFSLFGYDACPADLFEFCKSS